MARFYALIVLFAIIYGSMGMMVGGWSRADCNSTKFKDIANFATAQISSGDNCLFHMRHIKVDNCKTQVVSGIKYIMNILIGVTECKKNVKYSDEDMERCPLLSCKALKNCSATVWEQSWLNRKDLQEFSCQTQNNEVQNKPC